MQQRPLGKILEGNAAVKPFDCVDTEACSYLMNHGKESSHHYLGS